MKDSYFFKHDLNSRGDPKIERMVRAHGLHAYGIFWAVVEMLYEQGGRIAADTDHLAWSLREDPAKVRAVVSDFDLFFVEGDALGSASVDRRIEERRMLSEIGRQSAAKQLRKDGLPKGTKKDPKGFPEGTLSQEIREDKIREDKITDVVPSPSASEPPLLVFPVVGRGGGKEWGLTQAKVKEYQDAFPGVSIEAEARRALQWCRDNPAKQKTARGMPAFLWRWFAKQQNGGGGGFNGAGSKRTGGAAPIPGKYGDAGA